MPKAEEATATATATKPLKTASKLRQLKDRMWVREALEDLTAAEFASSLSVEDDDVDENTKKKKSRKRAVDFDNCLNKLDARIDEMCIVTTPEMAQQNNRTCHVLYRRVTVDNDADANGEGGDKSSSSAVGPIIENSCYCLSDNEGMGSVVYTDEQREALLERFIGSRERLLNFIEGSVEDGDAGEDGMDDIREQLKPPEALEGKNENNGGTKTTFDPSLYVREDGTVDWDGALQDREALKKFGSAVWSRINGQDPENNTNGEEGDEEEGKKGSSGMTMMGGEEFHTQTKAVTAKIEETEAIREKRDELDRLTEELKKMEVEHTKLLNSAISAGQAVANVNLATINASLRNKIRLSSDELDSKQAQVTFRSLDYELERIYTYLEGELGNTAAKGYIPLQDRLNVAEFGLLESQIDNFHRQLDLGESLDGDVLSVVTDQLVDFKRRLGIDYYVAGLTFDWEAIQVWLKDIWMKTKNGFTFYVKGTRLFVDDVVFCSSLILKALQGYTLKPREVRTLRRTFKDTITFIPVVIILLIPLSPIGHVLVFGAIQRVFPDFFPSCFTERRQNLLELYESTEYSAVTINETWTQKLIRVSQAIRVFVLEMVTKLYTSLGGVLVEQTSDKESDDS
eukprot:CAMPEP_0183720064 /NCGR_PEP_ID=MMETSP0737-20130205/12784_1 /TAXON_ID=385413 /ORGANISM="Thalassiosira miniscula, Strain CCMP1093" /LENGTH=626 /DNA_ID=CAMNT_0025949875 /DNA_START=402 /DNA_END=2282 /DNA_ORIENTATION=-